VCSRQAYEGLEDSRFECHESGLVRLNTSQCAENVEFECDPWSLRQLEGQTRGRARHTDKLVITQRPPTRWHLHCSWESANLALEETVLADGEGLGAPLLARATHRLATYRPVAFAMSLFISCSAPVASLLVHPLSVLHPSALCSTGLTALLPYQHCPQSGVSKEWMAGNGAPRTHSHHLQHHAAGGVSGCV
jgi:hypothetical protein